MKHWTTILLGTLLVGCFDDGSDEPPYPPLDARALVGCWEYVKPENACWVHCFARDGGYLSESSFFDRKVEYAEDSGAYWLSRNHINFDLKFRTSLGRSGTSDDGLTYTIIDDALQSVNPLGAERLARVHPDSFPCGLKPWRLFQKPAGWDSLIQRY